MKKLLFFLITTIVLSSCNTRNNDVEPMVYLPSVEVAISSTELSIGDIPIFLYEDFREGIVCAEWYSELIMITDTTGYIRYNQCPNGKWYVIETEEDNYMSVYNYFEAFHTITYEDLVQLNIIYPYTTNSFNSELSIDLDNLSVLSAKVVTYDGEINTNHNTNFTILDIDTTIDDIETTLQDTFNHPIEDQTISYSSLGFITYGTSLKAILELTDGEHVFFVKLVSDGTIIVEQNIKEDGDFFGFKLNDSSISNELEQIITDLYNQQYK